jgi:hypothetical protein
MRRAGGVRLDEIGRRNRNLPAFIPPNVPPREPTTDWEPESP